MTTTSGNADYPPWMLQAMQGQAPQRNIKPQFPEDLAASPEPPSKQRRIGGKKIAGTHREWRSTDQEGRDYADIEPEVMEKLMRDNQKEKLVRNMKLYKLHGRYDPIVVMKMINDNQ